MKIVKDEEGHIEGYEDMSYEDAMGVKCQKCGKLLEWHPDEDMIEEAHCCGISYRLYGTKYNIEIDNS